MTRDEFDRLELTRLAFELHHNIEDKESYLLLKASESVPLLSGQPSGFKLVLRYRTAKDLFDRWFKPS